MSSEEDDSEDDQQRKYRQPTRLHDTKDNRITEQLLCCISGCLRDASIRNYKSLKRAWPLKEELRELTQEQKDRQKICTGHYNEDLKERSQREEETSRPLGGSSSVVGIGVKRRKETPPESLHEEQRHWPSISASHGMHVDRLRIPPSIEAENIKRRQAEESSKKSSTRRFDSLHRQVRRRLMGEHSQREYLHDAFHHYESDYNNSSSTSSEVEQQERQWRDVEGERARLLSGVTVVYSLSNDPSEKYRFEERPLTKSDTDNNNEGTWGGYSLRFHVFYLETNRQRFELSLNSSSGLSTTYRWCAVQNPTQLDRTRMSSLTVPLEDAYITRMHDALSWSDIEWHSTGVRIAGQDYAIVRMFFLPPRSNE